MPLRVSPRYLEIKLLLQSSVLSDPCLSILPDYGGCGWGGAHLDAGPGNAGRVCIWCQMPPRDVLSPSIYFCPAVCSVSSAAGGGGGGGQEEKRSLPAFPSFLPFFTDKTRDLWLDTVCRGNKGATPLFFPVQRLTTSVQYT